MERLAWLRSYGAIFGSFQPDDLTVIVSGTPVMWHIASWNDNPSTRMKKSMALPAEVALRPAPVAIFDYEAIASGLVGYWTFDAANTSATTASDSSGQGNSATLVGGRPAYEWDAEDRLATVNNGTLRSEFSYDGFGRRVGIIEKNNGSVTSSKNTSGAGRNWCRS